MKTRELVRNIREEMGLSIRAFAKGIGVHRRVVEEWEKGTPPSEASATMIRHLANCKKFAREVKKAAKA